MFISFYRILAHSNIAFYLIHQFPRRNQRYFHLIQERTIRRPELCISRHGNLNRQTIYRGSHSHQMLSIKHFYLQPIRLSIAIRFNFYLYFICIYVGSCLYTCNIMLGHRFQPHSLPYTAYRSIPNATRVTNLLSPRLKSFICRVPDFNSQGIR